MSDDLTLPYTPAPGPGSSAIPEPVHEPEFRETGSAQTAVVKASGVPMSDMPGLFDSVFGTAFPALFATGIIPAGPPFAMYHTVPEGPETLLDLELGFPVHSRLDESVDAGEHEIVASTLPGGTLAVVSHLGSYDGLGDAWGGLMGEIAGSGRAPLLPFWEIYVTEPVPDMDPATLRTDLFCPVGTPDDAA